MRNLILIISLWLISALAASGQFLTTGDDPFHCRWRVYSQPDNPVQLLADSLCRNDASAMLFYSLQTQRFFPLKPITIVAHTAHAYSNGLATWAPKRVEAYTFPDRETPDCLPWLSHLTLHELRHVWQMQHINHLPARIAYILFGEQSVGLFSGLFVPRWLLEGDATWAETHFSAGGRGRAAHFMQQSRAISLSAKPVSYSAAFFGSYKRTLPNFYNMGYMLTEEATLLNGGTNPTERLLHHPFCSFKATLGITRGKLYKKATLRTDSLTALQCKDLPPMPVPSAGQRFMQSYVPLGNKRYVGYHKGLGDIGSFRLHSAGKSKVIATEPRRNEDAFWISGDTLIYTVRQPHPRWTNGSRELLIKRSLNSGKCFSRQEFSLPIDDAEISSFSVSNDTLVCTAISPEGTSIFIVPDFSAGNRQPQRLFTSLSVLAHPHLKNGSVFFSSDCNPTAAKPDSARLSFSQNEIYSFNIHSGRITQHTVSPCGACYPHVLGDSLFYALYTPEGLVPSSQHIRQKVSESSFNNPTTSVAVEQALNDSNIISQSPVKTYRGFLHSWGLVGADANSQTLQAAPTVHAQNLLGTLIASAWFNLNRETTNRINLQIKYTALWPQFSLLASYGKQTFKGNYLTNPQIEVNNQGQTDTLATLLMISGRSPVVNIKLNTSLPLYFYNQAWQFAVEPSVHLEYNFKRGTTAECLAMQKLHGTFLPINQNRFLIPRFFGSKSVNVSSSLYLHAIRSYAPLCIGARYGIALQGAYSSTLWGTKYGHQWWVKTDAYLPFIRYGNISAQFATQRTSQSVDNLGVAHGFGMVLQTPRGYSQFSAASFNMFRLAVAHPLANTEWEAGPVFYIKRIALQTFCDYARTTAFSRNLPDCLTAGADLWAETYFLRLPYPSKIGIRIAKPYLIKNTPTPQKPTIELLFSISFQ